MVSKASEDLPEPESPVMTVRRSRGISTLMFFRLCWRAPRTVIRSIAIACNRPRALQWRTSCAAETTIVNDRRARGQAEAKVYGTSRAPRRLRRRSLVRKGWIFDAPLAHAHANVAAHVGSASRARQGLRAS